MFVCASCPGLIPVAVELRDTPASPRYLEHRLDLACQLVKQAYSECPNLDLLIKAVLEAPLYRCVDVNGFLQQDKIVDGVVAVVLVACGCFRAVLVTASAALPLATLRLMLLLLLLLLLLRRPFILFIPSCKPIAWSPVPSNDLSQKNSISRESNIWAETSEVLVTALHNIFRCDCTASARAFPTGSSRGADLRRAYLCPRCSRSRPSLLERCCRGSLVRSLPASTSELRAKGSGDE